MFWKKKPTPAPVRHYLVVCEKADGREYNVAISDRTEAGAAEAAKLSGHKVLRVEPDYLAKMAEKLDLINRSVNLLHHRLPNMISSGVFVGIIFVWVLSIATVVFGFLLLMLWSGIGLRFIRP